VALVEGGLITSLPWVEEQLAKFKSGVPPAETVKALGARSPDGVQTLIRALQARPKRANFLSQRIAEALESSGHPEALEAVQAWRKSLP
jgi:hypothetical protein